MHLQKMKLKWMIFFFLNCKIARHDQSMEKVKMDIFADLS